MTIREAALAATKEWVSLHDEFSAMVESEAPIELQEFDDLVTRLNAAQDKAITLQREMLAKASQRARRQRRDALIAQERAQRDPMADFRDDAGPGAVARD
jgi:hypothetical protein